MILSVLDFEYKIEKVHFWKYVETRNVRHRSKLKILRKENLIDNKQKKKKYSYVYNCTMYIVEVWIRTSYLLGIIFEFVNMR